MVGQADQRGARRHVQAGNGVQRPARVGRDAVAVRAAVRGRRQPFRRAARERHAEQVAAGGVVRRGDEVDEAVPLVDPQHVEHVVCTWGEQAHVAAVAGDAVELAPAGPLARPQEAPSVLQPVRLVLDVQPRRVALHHDLANRAGARVGEQHPVRVLEAVHALQQQLARARPLHAREVVVARVAGQGQPHRLAAGRRHHAGAHRRVGGARLRVLHGDREGVERVRVVDQQEVAHAGHVELPVRDPGPVRGPAERVAQPELLLVDPVGGAVHARRGSVVREPCASAVGEPLHVEVALLHVRDPVPLRRELREHQRRGRPVRAELPQRARGAVEHPVVAARLVAPDALRVREQQQLAGVRRPGVIGDAHAVQLRGRDQHRACAGGGVVAHDVGAARGALHGRVGGAAIDPAGRAEALGHELVRREEPLEPGLHRLRERVAALRGERGRGGEQEDQREDCGATSHAVIRGVR